MLLKKIYLTCFIENLITKCILNYLWNINSKSTIRRIDVSNKWSRSTINQLATFYRIKQKSHANCYIAITIHAKYVKTIFFFLFYVTKDFWWVTYTLLYFIVDVSIYILYYIFANVSNTLIYKYSRFYLKKTTPKHSIPLKSKRRTWEKEIGFKIDRNKLYFCWFRL